MKHLTALIFITAASLIACGKAPDISNTANQPREHVDADKGAEHKGVMVDNPIIRPPLPGRSTAMATMVLMNHSDIDDRLIDIRGDIEGDVEIHTMLNDDGIMKMRRLENGIDLPKGTTHSLKSGGDHVMIFNTQIPSDVKTVDFVLVFEKAGEVHIQARVDDGSLDESGADDHSQH